MALILIIETATKNCSVAITKNGQVIESVDLNEGKFSHAEKLHLLINKLFKKTNIKIKELNAIAVGKGPGSYTGLRIGVSSAKGICYGLNIPLISFETLEILCETYKNNQLVNKSDVLIPMIDARRMEVYTAVFDSQINKIRPTKALILEKNSFDDFLGKRICHFFGDGAMKSKKIFNENLSVFIPSIYPSASMIAKKAYQAYLDKKFENIAYFEPYYLKDFIENIKKV